MTNNYGLDFETYSDVDLKTHGLDRYVSGEDFTPLIAAVQNTSGLLLQVDFIREKDIESSIKTLTTMLVDILNDSGLIWGHNVGFERRVLDFLGVDKSISNELRDSAVAARAAGAASSLRSSVPQLTNGYKMEEGLALIKKFSIPNEFNGYTPPTAELLESEADTLADWETFIDYCAMDALGSATIGEDYPYSSREHSFEQITARMNQVGWPVDVPLVQEMKDLYEENVQQALQRFWGTIDPKKELNFNSPLQLKNWCAARGVNSKSFDVDNVARMIPLLVNKLLQMDRADPAYKGYREVLSMLGIKSDMGGSGLKKLAVILNQVSADGRLRDQYVHAGAGQTLRSTGRGAQLQNLKRLGSNQIEDMESVYETAYDNNTLGENLRQVFSSSNPQGKLLVGDFASVESRGLAWLAGAEWKIEAFEKGLDLYKVQAQSIYGVSYAEVSKDQRQVGKIGELSCGYGAGGGAVQSFAKGYGVDFSEEEASQLVQDWRRTNPEVVELWKKLNELLKSAVSGRDSAVPIGNSLFAFAEEIGTPPTLTDMHPGARSIRVGLLTLKGGRIFSRVFHGCYLQGRGINFYKPTDYSNGKLWASSYTDKKTKRQKPYSIYGEKLTGILTQSLCREVFFEAAERLTSTFHGFSNTTLIGQFHDEIVVDWVPGDLSLESATELMELEMSRPPAFMRGFPLVTEVKRDYRYIK